MKGMNDRVHFRYRDGVNALIGRFRWRYEVTTRHEMIQEIPRLRKQGMDEFSYRLLGTTDNWTSVIEPMPAQTLESPHRTDSRLLRRWPDPR